MGPHKGASFFGMALITEFIDGIPLELGGAKTSVVFVAVRALNSSFPDRMVGGPALLSPYALMTEIAEVWLRGLQILSGPGMDGVAVIAGNPFDFMPGQVPEGQIFLFAMAGKAFRRLGLGIGESLAEDEDAHTSLTAFFHVGRSGAMAGLAVFLGGRAARDALLGMSR
jgi:hypothetical protein